MKQIILAAAVAASFLAVPATAEEPHVLVFDQQPNAPILYQTTMQLEKVDKVVYSWQLSITKFRDGSFPFPPILEVALLHDGPEPFRITEAKNARDQAELVIYPGDPQERCDLLPCSIDEAANIEIPAELLRSKEDLVVALVSGHTVKLLSVPASTIQELLAKSGI